MVELQQELKSNKAEIAYLEEQLRKKNEENVLLKAEKEMLLMDQMNNKSMNFAQNDNSDTIARYEVMIGDLNKKILILETAGAANSSDSNSFELMAYHRFNKNLKSRF